MDVVGRVSGRRRWSDAEKLEILTEAFRPGVRVCDVIARREVSSSLIYTWRKQLREGQLAGVMPSLPVFAEVQVAELTPPAPQPAPCPSSGLIQIDLPDGVRVRVDAHVDVGLTASSERVRDAAAEELAGLLVSAIERQLDLVDARQMTLPL